MPLIVAHPVLGPHYLKFACAKERDSVPKSALQAGLNGVEIRALRLRALNHGLNLISHYNGPGLNGMIICPEV